MASNKLFAKQLTLLLVSLSIALSAQFPAKYWVKFTNKNSSPYTISNPSAYLTAKSILRRTNQNIAIDITDIPVNQTYINGVNATGAVVFNRSRWLNAAIVIINSQSQLNTITNLPYVLNTQPVGKYKKTTDDNFIASTTTLGLKSNQITAYNYGQSFTQANQIGADCMHSLGFRGQNMIIAVIDAGFNSVNVNPVFDSLFNEGRLLGTRDFVQNNNMVYEDDSHGATVLSTIVGNSPGNLIGTGPKAKVWLLRSEEVAYEKIIEECNWVIAAEFADSVGADITTTSLGYTTFDGGVNNHVYAHLNGKTSVASIASTMAARKGMFVLNAAGNEGNGAWMYVGVPADADSICTVGAVNASGVHASFSSVGPTADGRIKPDVSTMGLGTYVCQPGYNFIAGNGTSFACPVMAGAVACLWQAHPNKTNMQIMQAIKATASQSVTADNTYGWGIPNICAAHNYLTLITANHYLNTLNEFKLYPNPANDRLQIKTQKIIESVEVFDLMGKAVVATFYNNTVEFNNAMPVGIYFITIKTKEGSYNLKFVKA